MNIIKLNAISSTNDYLKELLQKQYVENFTVVVADNQTAGRGQMGAQWQTEKGKNLTFSVLVKDLLLAANAIFDLNVAVAVSVVNALEISNIKQLSIKWPNDILAGNNKVGGILIENSIKNDGEIVSIVGIGINVNQIDFANLPKASSLAREAGREFDRDLIFQMILDTLKRNIAIVLRKESDILWSAYHQMLFKKGLPMPFEGAGKPFMGIIKKVTKNGSLEILLADDSVKTFNVKELKMLY